MLVSHPSDIWVICQKRLIEPKVTLRGRLVDRVENTKILKKSQDPEEKMSTQDRNDRISTAILFCRSGQG